MPFEKTSDTTTKRVVFEAVLACTTEDASTISLEASGRDPAVAEGFQQSRPDARGRTGAEGPKNLDGPFHTKAWENIDPPAV